MTTRSSILHDVLTTLTHPRFNDARFQHEIALARETNTATITITIEGKTLDDEQLKLFGDVRAEPPVGTLNAQADGVSIDPFCRCGHLQSQHSRHGVCALNPSHNDREDECRCLRFEHAQVVAAHLVRGNVAPIAVAVTVDGKSLGKAVLGALAKESLRQFGRGDRIADVKL